MRKHVVMAWKSIRLFFGGAWIQNRVERNPSFDEAVKFSDQYKPNAGKDCKWTLDYAIKEFESASSRIDSLDSKADTLIGYLGAGSGFVSIGLAYGVGSHRAAVLIASIPALLLLLSAIIAALAARMPSKYPILPPTKDALEYANDEKSTAEQSMGRFSAYIWVSSHSLSLAAREKANIVRYAYRLFGAGITWLVLASIISVFASH